MQSNAYVAIYQVCFLHATHVTTNLILPLQGTLRPEEIKQLMSSAHRPNYILLVLSELIEHTDIVTPERFRMDQNLTFLHDAHGACERLLKTPIPLSYTRYNMVNHSRLKLGQLLASLHVCRHAHALA